MQIDISKIHPNPNQPRKQFDQGELDALSESIKLHGLINPIAVEEQSDGTYLIIDGERRWRAAKRANLATIEASVRPGLNGSGALERMILATTANLQRSDLNPVEKAKAYQALLDMGLSQVEVARTLGISASGISNTLKILELPGAVVQLIATSQLTGDVRMVKALLDLEDEEMIRAAARAGASRKMSADRIIQLCQRMSAGVRVSRQNSARREQDAAYADLQWNMVVHLGNPSMNALLHKAAMATCKSCALFESASRKVCVECPGVTLLSKLVEANYGN